MTILRQLATILIPEIIVLCFLVTYFWVDLQSTATLLIFNVLYLSLLTQLNGDRLTKMALLATGNAVGMAWNYSFHVLIMEAANSLIIPNTTLSMFYTVAYPFLNSFWVIAFWSLSLTKLHPSRAPQGKAEYVY